MHCAPNSSARVLAEDLFEELFVEAHDDRLALADRRSAQVAGRPEHRCNDFRTGLAAGELVHLLALGDDHFRRRFGERGRIGFCKLAAGGDDLFCLDSVGVQKLGRSRARRSTLAVVVPLNLFRHAGNRSTTRRQVKMGGLRAQGASTCELKRRASAQACEAEFAWLRPWRR